MLLSTYVSMARLWVYKAEEDIHRLGYYIGSNGKMYTDIATLHKDMVEQVHSHVDNGEVESDVPVDYALNVLGVIRH